MNAIMTVCFVILTAVFVGIIIILGMAVQDIRRMRVRLVDFLDTMEHELKPLFSEIARIAEDVREITFTTRCQVEKVESTSEFINKNLHDIMERWVVTINLVTDALTEPLENVAFFLKGLSKGIQYLWSDGKGRQTGR